MVERDAWIWRDHEDTLYEAALRLCWKHNICLGKFPPHPSTFGYKHVHRSEAIADRTISIARDWFGIWMGYLSYLIAWISDAYAQESDVIVPNWYSILREAGFSEAWLNGMLSSPVCTFGGHIPCAGIVIQWTDKGKSCPELEFFLSRDIPMTLIWSSAEEDAVIRNPDLAYLEPPKAQLCEQIIKLFDDVQHPHLASTLLSRFNALRGYHIIDDTTKYLWLDQAPSNVVKIVHGFLLDEPKLLENTKLLTSQMLCELLATQEVEQRQAATEASTMPLEHMVEKDVDEVAAVQHFDNFFSAQAQRQKELEPFLSAKKRQAWESRKVNYSTTSSTIYAWHKTTSSSGSEVWVRSCIGKKKKMEVYYTYDPKDRRYNTFFDKWDLCDEFSGPRAVVQFSFSDNELDDDSHGEGTFSDYRDNEQDISSDIPGHMDIDTTPVCPDTVELLPRRSVNSASATSLDDPEIFICDRPPVQDIHETLSRVYGYTSPLTDILHSKDGLLLDKVIQTVGIRSDPPSDLMERERQAILLFISTLAKGKSTPPMRQKRKREGPSNSQPSEPEPLALPVLPMQLNDLNDTNISALSYIAQFRHIVHPSSNLFVIHAPRSSSCDWSLGLHSVTAVLYALQLITSNPVAHTLFTINVISQTMGSCSALLWSIVLNWMNTRCWLGFLHQSMLTRTICLRSTISKV